MVGHAVNSGTAAQNQAVAGAMQGADPVNAAIGGAIDPVSGYIQAGAAALTALNGLSQNGATGAPNVSTPNFNNAPTSIVNFGPGDISASANPTNTQTATAPGNSGNAVSGLFSGISSTVLLIFGGLAALIVLKKAKA